MRISTVSEIINDAAYFGIAGAFLGHRIVKWISPQFSATLTTSQFVVGGILNAVALAAADDISKKRNDPPYKKTSIRIVALAYACFISLYLPKGLTFNASFSLGSAVTIALFDLVFKLIIDNRATLSSLAPRNPPNQIDSTYAEKIKRLKDYLKKDTIQWEELPESIQKSLEKHFKNLDTPAMSPDSDQVKEIQALEIDLLWKATNNTHLDKEVRTALNILFFKKEYPPQALAHEGDAPDQIKALVPSFIRSLTDNDLQWIFLFSKQLPQEITEELILQIFFPETVADAKKSVNDARKMGQFLVSKLHEGYKAETIPLAIRTVFNINYGRDFPFSYAGKVNFDFDQELLLLRQFKKHEIDFLYDETNKIQIGKQNRTVLNSFFYLIGKRPQVNAQEGDPPKGLENPSLLHAGRNEKNLEWCKKFACSSIQTEADVIYGSE